MDSALSVNLSKGMQTKPEVKPKFYSTHSGVKFMIQDSPWFGEATKTWQEKLVMYTWCDLTKEYIYEGSVKSEEHARKRIDELMHFL